MCRSSGAILLTSRGTNDGTQPLRTCPTDVCQASRTALQEVGRFCVVRRSANEQRQITEAVIGPDDDHPIVFNPRVRLKTVWMAFRDAKKQMSAKARSFEEDLCSQRLHKTRCPRNVASRDVDRPDNLVWLTAWHRRVACLLLEAGKTEDTPERKEPQA